MRHPLGRCEVLRARVANIGFGRPDIAARRQFRPFRRDSNRAIVEGRGSVLSEKRLDYPLGFGILALAEVVVTNSPLGVDEVVGRPVFVAEGPPDGMVAVYWDGVRDVQVRDGGLDVGGILLEAELRSMDAEHDEAGIFVFCGP